MIAYDETVKLIDELQEAAQIYYQNLSEPLMTDEEFDYKQEHLSTLVDSYPDLFAPGTKGSLVLEGDPGLGTTTETNSPVTHKQPMLSLEKVKTEDEVLKFAKKMRKNGAKNFQLQAKLDGFALALEYSNGSLQRISTRGDGNVGDDLSYLSNSDKLSIEGLPHQVSINDNFEVRGEIFFRDENFEKADNERAKQGNERFKNSRNAAVGLMRRAETGLEFPVEMTFSVYAFLKEDEFVDIDELPKGFLSITELTKEQAPDMNLSGYKTDDELHNAIEEFGKIRENFTIPTDGVVIKPTNESEMHKIMGNTSHHPSSQVAYKYPSPTAETILEEITVTVGKTGRLTPVGKITPTSLSGTLISNVSLHNYNWLSELDARVGSTIVITRSNDVIPYVKAVVSTPENAPAVETPTKCPVCESTLTSKGDVQPPKLLQCSNTKCPSRMFFNLKTAVGKNYLDIDGLSEVMLEHLHTIGRVNDIGDLFTLTVNELKDYPLGESKQGNPRRLGEARAENIVKHLEKAKTRPLAKLLASLGVESLGSSSSKDLVKEFKTLENLQNATSEDISSLEKFGEIKSEKIVKGLKYMTPVIEKMKTNGVIFNDDTNDNESNELSGVSFAISGTVPQPFNNRNDWVDFIEENGGEFHSSPKKNTTYMIAESDGTSSKVKKAHDLSIEFMTAEEFTEKFTK